MLRDPQDHVNIPLATETRIFVGSDDKSPCRNYMEPPDKMVLLVEGKEPTSPGFWIFPSSAALEPKCSILMFTGCVGP